MHPSGRQTPGLTSQIPGVLQVMPAQGSGVLVCVGVFVGVLVRVLVGVLVGVFVRVLVGVFVGVLVRVFVGVLVGVFVGVLVGVGVGFTQMPLKQTFGSRQHSPFAQTDASGGNPPARVL